METNSKAQEEMSDSNSVLDFKTTKKIKHLKKEIKEINELIGAIDFSIIKLNKHSRFHRIQYHVNELNDTRIKLRSFLEDKKVTLDYLEKSV